MTVKFGMTLLQERHWMEIEVAFDLIPEALTIIPGIFTSFDTISDYKDNLIIVHSKKNF